MTATLPFVPLAVIVFVPATVMPVADSLPKTRNEPGGNLQAGNPVMLLVIVRLSFVGALYNRKPFKAVNAHEPPPVEVRADKVIVVELLAITTDGSTTAVAQADPLPFTKEYKSF